MRRGDLDPLDEAIRETLPELVRWLPWAHLAHTRADSRRYIRQARLARLRSATYEFAALDDGTSRLLGVVGLHRVDWSRRSASLGYWIRSSEWGHGLGTEAAGCVTEHGFRTLGLNRIEAHVAPDNLRSQRVVGKLGFKAEGLARDIELVAGRFVDHVQYSLLRREVVGPEDSL